MNSLTVLSPHQDDAALSVGMTIRAAARSGRPVRILNCFTVSEYAPHNGARGAAEVGRVRQAEDREFASRMGAAVEVIDLGLEDAPIRFGCPVSAVRRRRVGVGERETAARIAEALARVADGLVLAPLGLGRHIDHLVAREAAIRFAQAGGHVAFYEDLPYAAELRDCCVRRAADGAALRVGTRLGGGVVRDREAASRKRFAIEAYESQLSAEQFDAVIGYGARRGGERLWGTGTAFGSIPKLENAEVEAGSPASAWARRMQCASHAAANRARAAIRRAMELVSGGGVNAPQTN
jgi:LmbE family N-acetylglucosaminyl deacetylase